MLPVFKRADAGSATVRFEIFGVGQELTRPQRAGSSSRSSYFDADDPVRVGGRDVVAGPVAAQRLGVDAQSQQTEALLVGVVGHNAFSLGAVKRLICNRKLSKSRLNDLNQVDPWDALEVPRLKAPGPQLDQLRARPSDVGRQPGHVDAEIRRRERP